jgi:hypothetical protein
LQIVFLPLILSSLYDVHGEVQNMAMKTCVSTWLFIKPVICDISWLGVQIGGRDSIGVFERVGTAQCHATVRSIISFMIHDS